MMFRDLFPPRRPAFHIATLTGDHAAGASAIHAASFARPWDTLELERMIAADTIYSDGVFLGTDTALLGFALSRLVADEAEILTLAIDLGTRGQGAGWTLLSAHLDRLSRAGTRAVFLEVDEGNEPALALYRRAGFAEIGRRPGYYPKPDGTKATAIAMRATLG
ncbi:GNAT family N-acetyltransferase [Pseudochelatococcus sp. B33]